MATRQVPSAAVIDIGSNSIRYMEAAVTPQGVAAFYKQLRTTRLAQGLDESGILSKQSMARSLEAVVDFVDQACKKKLPVFAYATSAVRDAANRQEFIGQVHHCCGIGVTVLSGEEEARCAYLGAVGEMGGGLIDIGGGSAQVIAPGFAQSYPIGCVRAMDAFARFPYGQARREIDCWVDRYCKTLPQGIARWVGVGGTLTTLGALQAGLTAYDPQVVSRQKLTQASLEKLLTQLEEMGEECKIHPLLAQRHDVILFGAAVAARLMQRIGVEQLEISEADGMEGFLLCCMEQRR